MKLAPVVVIAAFGAWIFGQNWLQASYRNTTASSLPTNFADGFDFPVGGGTGAGYYTARRMTPYGHMGDDWNGRSGGNSDLGDPVLSIADGLVVYSHDYGSSWGQVVIVRHKYRDRSGQTKYVDSFYGHVRSRLVSVGQQVRRGQRIASIGNNRGMYVAHLHMEIRKNINVGIQTWNFSKSHANYHQPTSFIASHRPGMISKGTDLRLARNTKKAKPSPQPKTQSTVAQTSPGSPRKPAAKSEQKQESTFLARLTSQPMQAGSQSGSAARSSGGSQRKTSNRATKTTSVAVNTTKPTAPSPVASPFAGLRTRLFGSKSSQTTISAHHSADATATKKTSTTTRVRLSSSKAASTNPLKRLANRFRRR